MAHVNQESQFFLPATHLNPQKLHSISKLWSVNISHPTQAELARVDGCIQRWFVHLQMHPNTSWD